ncbi:TIGR03016 family PEP-CTERM system-associated outer membrane protein [Alginatibacterium sediminis]|uniref:TIGR03016 family PEP-CTERM system-associated outer membrane protein n=1 Tax=Alginatibacterium sediminis TaxID=2164068 RepID=A0A420E789_9ALTE|nr:TIGR03016 family PEP-CTERM system-associated outer membrane protein [Alginatibacterium sediminis]RKF14402.1 TIGR03016 family PEP-CTERM system-associated outer membrane protein [Alginatibacterium sediminis]
MDMDMATDMATETATAARKRKETKAKLQSNSKFLLLASLSSIVFGSSAAEVEFSPQVNAEAVYTDNALLDNDNKQGGEIGIISAGVLSSVTGNDGEATFNYLARQTYFSYDSSQNQLFHDLDFQFDKGLGNSGFRLDGDARIDVQPANIAENALTDLISGDLIQSSTYGLGLRYGSNPGKLVEVSGGIETRLTSFEDDRGNNDSQRLDLRLANGSAEKKYFWLIDGEANRRESTNSGSDTYDAQYRLEFGLQQINGFSPFLKYNGESATEDRSSSQRSAEFESWGPGLRYYYDQNTYLEMSYNFSLDRSVNDDYIGAAINLEPTARTRLFFEYSKRFFGDSYAFSFRHNIRRLTTEISYDEKPTSYDRRYTLDDVPIEELRLAKTLRWQTDLNLRRGSANLILLDTETSSFIGGSGSNDHFQSLGLGYLYPLSRKLDASFDVSWDRRVYKRTAQTTNDRYNRWGVSLSQRFAHEVVVRYRYNLNFRSSDYKADYTENRISIDINKAF